MVKDREQNEQDELFQLPLNRFTTARNALASRLKKAGRDDAADRVKALVKPSVSAWAVNQLFWKHKEAYDRLVAAGRRLFEAQKSQLAGKPADMEEARAAQRQALRRLSRLAEEMLRSAGHKPTPDLMRRIDSTLDALSAYSAPDAASPGRLTADISPPGFDSLAALMPAGGPAKAPVRSARVIPFKPPEKQGRREGAGIPSARAALRAAERALQEARKKAENLAAAREKAAAQANEARKRRLEAEEHYDRARFAEQEARRRLDNAGAEAEKAARAVDEAVQAAEKARDVLHGNGVT